MSYINLFQFDDFDHVVDYVDININNNSNNTHVNDPVAIGICAGILDSDQIDHNNSIVTAEYPLANAIFVDNSQTLINDDDFLILSNTEENNINWSFDDIIFAEPITDDICIAKESNYLKVMTLRDTLNSIDESNNNNNNNNNNWFKNLDTLSSTKLQVLHDLGYDLSQCEKDDLFDNIKNSNEKEHIENNKEITKSKVEKLIKITKNANYNNISLLVKNNQLPSCAEKIEMKKYREEAIRRYKEKRHKRNWLKQLPDMKNRSEAAKRRPRETGKGIFKRKSFTTNT